MERWWHLGFVSLDGGDAGFPHDDFLFLALLRRAVRSMNRSAPLQRHGYDLLLQHEQSITTDTQMADLKTFIPETPWMQGASLT